LVSIESLELRSLRCSELYAEKSSLKFPLGDVVAYIQESKLRTRKVECKGWLYRW
jgi:hypothetical protein